MSVKFRDGSFQPAQVLEVEPERASAQVRVEFVHDLSVGCGRFEDGQGARPVAGGLPGGAQLSAKARNLEDRARANQMVLREITDVVEEWKKRGRSGAASSSGEQPGPGSVAEQLSNMWMALSEEEERVTATMWDEDGNGWQNQMAVQESLAAGARTSESGALSGRGPDPEEKKE